VSLVRFVVGRLSRRMLRADAIEGYLGDDAGGPETRGTFVLRKQPGSRLGLEAPGADVLSISAEGTAALAAGAGSDVVLLIGWPEQIFVVRRGGAVMYGEGDVVHFGDLALDQMRTLRRTGYDYITETSSEVRAHLELEERGAIQPDRAMRRLGFAGGDRGVNQAAVDAMTPQPSDPGPAATSVYDTIRLAPGQKTRFGAYELVNERSYDHERRHVAGQTGHAYFFRLRRVGEDPVGSRDKSLPDPFLVKDGTELVAAARRLGLLDEDEVLTGESALGEWLTLFEGPRGALEKELRAAGPASPQLRWRGDVLEAHAARLGRADGGAPLVGRAVVTLAPVGLPRVVRTTATILPGRLRRPPR
jgi:hypothetical protein